MRNVIRRNIVLTALLTAVVVAVSPTSYANNDHGSELAQVRAATSRYHQHQVAVDEGFGELADHAGQTCIEDPGGAGAMGTHWVIGARVGDGVINATEPEVLLYDMTQQQPRLLGVEYVVFVADWEGDDPPMLFGHEFHFVDEPNRYGLPPFYELHAWLWQQNPSGMFEDWNPRIDC